MKNRLITVTAFVAAIVGWWGLFELTGQVEPEQPGALPFIFALLFLALTATFTPAVAYLNRRFAPKALEHDPLRFLRQSAWGALCITSWAWLQTLRAFNIGFALVIALMFVAVEVLIERLRGEARE